MAKKKRYHKITFRHMEKRGGVGSQREERMVIKTFLCPNLTRPITGSEFLSLPYTYLTYLSGFGYWLLLEGNLLISSFVRSEIVFC